MEEFEYIPTVNPEYGNDDNSPISNVPSDSEESIEGEVVEDSEDESVEVFLESDTQTIEEAIFCLHNDVHFMVNDFLPFSIAVLIIYLGCYWFYTTFCR